MCLVPRKRLIGQINLTVIVIALVVTALDELSKFWARHVLANHAVHVGGSIWLRLRYNSGISFSFNQSRTLLTSIVTVIVAVAVVVVGLRARRGLATIGFGLLIGGGVANVVDRLTATPQPVTGVIALGSIPLFNLADVAVTAGFITLLVAALTGERLLT